MSLVKFAEMGLKNFSKYGKLIGTGKNNGIKVYEALEKDGQRVLISFDKNGKLVKTVKQQSIYKGYDMPKMHITEVKNYQKGKEMMHTWETQSKYINDKDVECRIKDRIVRSDKNTWESLTLETPHKADGTTAYSDIDGKIQYSFYDFNKQSGLKVLKDKYTNMFIDSFKIRNGKKDKLSINGLKIPNHIEAEVRSSGVQSVYGGEANVCEQIADYFNKFFQKIAGYKGV